MAGSRGLNNSSAPYNVDFSPARPLHGGARSRVSAQNTRFRGNEAHFLLDHALAEIGVGVRWLREHAGAERVVLLGNSGGGSLMAAYQSQAVEPNVTPVAGMRPLSTIEDLPAGDLFLALAAHSGRPEVLTNWLDPSVTDETDPLATDPAAARVRGDSGQLRHGVPASCQRLAQRAGMSGSQTGRARLAALADARARDRLFNLYRTWWLTCG